MPPLSVLIKPASGMCNMQCSYCFYTDEMENREIANYGIMSGDTLENVIRKSLTAAEGFCTFAFQGGEPTLAGLEFFETVVSLEKQYNTKSLKVSNVLQTNGYAIDRRWAEFLKREDFLVGVSLDGTKEIHDRYRMDHSGRGTHDKVMGAVKLLQEYDVEFNILSVVTRRSAQNIGKAYELFRRNGLTYQQYIPCMGPLHEGKEMPEWALSAKAYETVLCRLFDEWYADLKKDRPVYNRYFTNLANMVHGYPPESCDMMGHCSNQYVIEADGSVYPCDFYVLDEWQLGNINADDFAQLDARCRELKFIEQSLPVPAECQTCEWYRLCRNGCRRERLSEPDGTVGKNKYCRAYQNFFRYAVTQLRKL